VSDSAGVHVRPLAAEDLDEADRICRVAFGTFLQVPEPETFFGAAELVRTRWKADPGAALGRDRAWQVLAGRGFRRDFQGVTMHRPGSCEPEPTMSPFP
jgi:hypothetical protein